jgi:hypothetical protein
LACKIQALIEPLCKKRSDFILTDIEQKALLASIASSNQNFSQVISAYGGLTAGEMLRAIERHNLVYSESVKYILEPRLSLWNKLGLAAWKTFSVGTECPCCWGWRVVIGSAVVFGSGFLLGKI